jgi:hypothetical protein
MQTVLSRPRRLTVNAVLGMAVLLLLAVAAAMAFGQDVSRATQEFSYAEVQEFPPSGNQWVVVLKINGADTVTIGFVAPFTVKLSGIKPPQDPRQADASAKVLEQTIPPNTLLRAKVGPRDKQGRVQIELFDSQGYSVAKRLQQGGYVDPDQ